MRTEEHFNQKSVVRQKLCVLLKKYSNTAQYSEEFKSNVENKIGSMVAIAFRYMPDEAEDFENESQPSRDERVKAANKIINLLGFITREVLATNTKLEEKKKLRPRLKNIDLAVTVDLYPNNEGDNYVEDEEVVMHGAIDQFPAFRFDNWRFDACTFDGMFTSPAISWKGAHLQDCVFDSSCWVVESELKKAKLANVKMKGVFYVINDRKEVIETIPVASGTAIIMNSTGQGEVEEIEVYEEDDMHDMQLN